MRSLGHRILQLAALGAAWLTCCALNAQENGSRPALQGVFVNEAQSEEPIKAAIETALKEFNFITRPIARSRLKKTNSAIKRVSIMQSGTTLTVTLDTGNAVITEPGRPAIKWTRGDGEVFDVATEWQGPTLVQTFSAEDGKRTNRYTLSSDGSALTMQVTLSSPQLKAPLQYSLNFKRQ